MADETINAEELQSQADANVRNEIANKWTEKRDALLAEKTQAVEEPATETIPEGDKMVTPKVKAEAEKELSKLSENQLKQWQDKLTNLYKTETKKAGLTDEEAQAIIADAKAKGTTEGKYVDIATQGKQTIDKLQQQQDAFNKKIEMQMALDKAWYDKQAEQVSQKVRKDLQKQAQADAIKAQADAFVKKQGQVSDNIKTSIKDSNPLKADFSITPQRVANAQAERQMQDNVDTISKELDKPLDAEFAKAKEQTTKDNATLRANQGAFMPQMATGMLEGINEAKNLDVEKIAKASADTITKGKKYTKEQEQQIYQIALSKAYDKAKGKTTSNTEHIVRKAFLDNSVANLMKAGVAKSSGNYLLNQASQERDAEYGAKHKFADVVGTVGSFVTDLGAMGAGSAGSAVGSRVGGAIAGTLARNLVMRSGGKVALNTAMRMVANKAIVPIAGAMAGGATNLGLWEGMSDATNQLSTSKDYSFGQTLGAMGRGAILGTMTGGVGHLIGNITNKAVSAVSSTGAKVGAKVGGGLASWGAETTIFATPEMIADPEHAGDIWLDNGAMMAGFKAHSGVKSAGKFIDGVRKFKGNDLSASQLAFNNKPIFQRVKEQFKAHPNECKFTPDEEAEIRNGYSGLLNLDSGLPAEEYKSLLGKFMDDKNVSASAKSRMSFILTGKRMAMPTILTTEIKEQDGKHVVIAYGLNDTIVMRKSFSDAKQAQRCLVETGEQAQINNVEILESDAKAKGGDVNAIRESVKEDTGVDIGKVLAKSVEERTDEEHDAYADYMDKLAQVKPKEDKLEVEPAKDGKVEEVPSEERTEKESFDERKEDDKPAESEEKQPEEERSVEPSEDVSEEIDATHEREDDAPKESEERDSDEPSVTEEGETKSEDEKESESFDERAESTKADERAEDTPSENAVEDNRAGETPITEEPKADERAEADSEVRQKSADSELSGELSDKQGNPINEDGTLKLEKVNSLDELTDKDFTEPFRNVQLPTLPTNVDNAIGAEGKPVIIKKNILLKNLIHHSDLSAAQGREILNNALYNPTLYGQNQKTHRPYNWILIHNAQKHSSVILEVNHSKDYVEIVNWHYLDEKSLEQKRRQAIKEGGLILTLKSAAGDTHNDLSSAGKVSETAETAQANVKENAEHLSEVATETAGALGMKVRFAYSDELKGRKAISKGWLNPGTGEIIVVLDNNVDADDIRATVYHEGVAHYGLRKMFGSEFDNFIQNVYDHTGTEIRKAIAKIGVENGYDPMTSTEEYLGKLAEDGKFKELNPSSWEKIKYFFKGMLSRFGLRKISDDELRYSLWRSYQLRINGSKPTLMERAMDIAMQHRFKLGDYAPRPKRLYRTMGGGQIPKRKIAKEYDEQIGESSYQAKEAFLDENASLDWYLRKASMLKHQEDVPGHINPYLGANRVGQVTKEDIEHFERDFTSPIHNEVRRLMGEIEGKRTERYQKITEYLMAKHGLERNNVMRQRATEERAKETYQRAVDQLPTLDGKLKATAYDLQQNPNDPSCKTAYNNALLARDEAKQIIDDAQADWGAFVASHDVAETKARQRLQNLQVTQINAMADVQQAQTKMQKSPNNKTCIEAYDKAAARLKAIRDEIDYATNDWDLFVLQYSDDYAGLTGLTKGESEQSVPLDEATRRARQIVKSFESAHKTDELWNRINKATHEILRKQYEGGMISEDKMNEIAGTYQYYVPLRGFNDTTTDEEYAYLQHGEGRQNVLKKAEGRSSMADDPLAYIEQMAKDGIITANDNALVKRTFLDFVQSHPTDLISATPIYIHRNPVSGKWEMADLPQIDPNDSAEVVEEKMRKYVEQMENLIQTDSRNYRKVSEKVKIPYIIDKNKLKEHQIIAYRDGVPTLMTVNGNPRLAQAINNVRTRTEGAVDSIVHTLKNLTRKVSMMYTGMNLDFIPSNFTRDSIFANTIVWIKESPKYALQFNKNYLALGAKDGVFATAQLFNRYRNGTLNMNNYIDKMFYEFMRNGAEVSYAEMASIEKTKKKVMRSIEGKKTLGETITKNAVAETISDIARGVENRARFAAYLTSREAGRDIARSVWDAREISVNFITRGARDKYFRKTGQTFVGNASGILSEVGNIGYAFFNASLQGSANFARAVNRNRAKGLAMCSGLFALGLATAWLGKQQDDDDDDNKYFDQPKHLRRQNMIVKSGKNWITVPLNTEYRAFFGFGEMVGSQLFNGDDISASDVAMQFTQLAPVDVLEGGKAFVPTVIKPIAEASSNESWYGSPIWKETPYNELAPQYTKAYSSTPKYMVEWAEKLNTLSGGNKYRKGTLDWNPATIDYLLKQYGGSFYALPRQTYGLIKDAKGDKDFNWRDVPMANRFIKTGGDERRTNASLNEKFEDIRQKYEMVWYDFNNTRRDRLMDADERLQHLDEMMQNEDDWLRLRGMMKGYDKLTARRNQMAKTGEQDAVKAINQRIQELKQEIVDRVEEAESKK